jgi:hypothetical protein
MGYNIPFMKGRPVFHRKNILPSGDIVEMKIWRVPVTSLKPHGLKYSLVYIRKGRRVFGYDNAEGKGDHKHEGIREMPYRFIDIDNLIRDFLADVDSFERDRI